MNSLQDVLEEKAKANSLLMEKKYFQEEAAYVFEQFDYLLNNDHLNTKTNDFDFDVE